MITKGIIQDGCAYLIPDAESSYVEGPYIENLEWGADSIDVSIFRHIGAYPTSAEGMKLVKLHLAIITRLTPDAPSTKSWKRQVPSENTLIFRKWIDDYDLDS